MLRYFGRLAASALVVITLAACADDPQAPFAVEGSGTIAGRVFFDADNNGRFTPIGGDTALAGLTVQLRERGSSVIIATTTSGTDGSFSFSDVPAGTHDVFIVNSTGTLAFCVNPSRASVFLSEQAFVSVTAKRGCVVKIDVGEKQAQGSPVTVSGVVTVRQGTFRGDNTYIQDNTGGIQIFGLPTSLGLQEGDSIEVSGTLGLFRTEIQIVSPQVVPNIKRVPLIVPKQMTAGAIGALTPISPDVGRLVVVRRATVGTTFTSGNSTITDASGSAVLRLDGAVATAIPTSTFAAGKCYDVTGVVGIFDNAAQLKPRKLADVVEVPCAL